MPKAQWGFERSARIYIYLYMAIGWPMASRWRNSVSSRWALAPEQADAAVVHLIENVGWSSEDVNVEELDLTEEEWEEIAKMNRPPEWFTGPRGGTYRLSRTGRSRIYI